MKSPACTHAPTCQAAMAMALASASQHAPYPVHCIRLQPVLLLIADAACGGDVSHYCLRHIMHQRKLHAPACDGSHVID